MSELFPGRPVWVDYAADDPAAAREWYGGLMPWEFEESGPEYGNYIRARFEGADVAGIFKRPDDAPLGWNLYLHSDDVALTCQKAVEAGGAVAAEPFEVPMVGEMAVILDPGFIGTGVWKTSGMSVIDLQQRYGAVWFENWSHSTAKAAGFYGDVFGLTNTDMEGMDYKILQHGDQQIAAVGAIEDDGPALWAIYFSTDNVDRCVEYTLNTGGQLMREAEDTPYGRMAALADPFGARFKVMTPPM